MFEHKCLCGSESFSENTLTYKACKSCYRTRFEAERDYWMQKAKSLENGDPDAIQKEEYDALVEAYCEEIARGDELQWQLMRYQLRERVGTMTDDKNDLMVELEFLNDALGTVLNTLQEIKESPDMVDVAPQVIRLKRMVDEWEFKKMDINMLKRANDELGRRLSVVQSVAGVSAGGEAEQE